MLCKLTEGMLVDCPETIRVTTNDEEIKKKFGWMPYVPTDAPTYDSTSEVLEHTYEVQDGAIVDVYTVSPMTVPDGEV